MKERAATIVVLVASAICFLPGPSAVARSSNPNGWGAGAASNQISGHVGGGGKPAPKPVGGRPRPKPVKSTGRPRPRPAPVGGAGGEAADAFTLPPPLITANPTATGLVGVESRFWATAPQLIARDIEAAGVRAHVEARPAALVWRTGDGQAGQTAVGERPMPDSTEPSGGIGFAFASAGTVPVTCTVLWDVRWSSSDGGAGTIADRSSEASVAYPVAERRSVLTAQ